MSEPKGIVFTVEELSLINAKLQMQDNMKEARIYGPAQQALVSPIFRSIMSLLDKEKGAFKEGEIMLSTLEKNFLIEDINKWNLFIGDIETKMNILKKIS